MAENINNVLSKIEGVIPSDISKTMQSSATPEELSELSKTIFSGDEIPSDIKSLLQWHNGQDWNAPLSKNNNRRLLTISEILDTWLFFNDPMSDYLEPWSKSWIPILTNDSGSYVVYESEGNNSGKLIAYWHDSEDRNVIYESILDWAKELLSEYE